MIRKLTIVGILLFLIGGIGVVATGFDFGEELLYHEKQWGFRADDLKHLVIESSSNDFDVRFVQSNDGYAHVEFKGNIEQMHFDELQKAELENGTLTLDLYYRSQFRFFTIHTGRNDREIIVALPDGVTLQSLTVDKQSARGTFDNVKANKVEIHSTSGDVRIHKLIADELVIDIHSGEVKANDVTANVHITSTSGEITMKELDGEGYFRSTSGEIEITQKGTGSLDVETSSGEVEIMPSASFAGFIDLQSNSGRIKSIEAKRETTDLIKVRTKSGDIEIKR